MSLRSPRADHQLSGQRPDDPVELSQELPFDLDGLRVEPSLARVLLPTGAVHQLQPRVMQVLIALARRAGETVSRDDLMRACWGEVVVGEDALTRAVLRLRNLFEEAGGVVSIETVPRIGYRLNGTVQPIARATADAIADAPAPVGTMQVRRVWIAAGAAATMVVAFAAAVLLLRQPESDSADTNALRLTPITFEPGIESEPALSPDGGQLVYVGNDPNAKRRVLLLRSTSGGDPVALTDEYAYAPAWSPDGGRIAYAKRSATSACRLYVRAVPGGTEREIGQCTGPGLTSLTWTPNGNGLIYADRAADGLLRRLMQRDLNGGAVQALTSPPSLEIGDEHPSLSPDGSRIAFVRVHQIGNEDVAVMDLASKQITTLFTRADSIESVAWTADGKFVLATGYGPNGAAFWRIDAATGARKLLMSGMRNIGMVTNARLKDRIVLETVTRRENLTLLDIWADGRISEPRPILESSSRDRTPSFAPDGKRLVFVSDRGGRADLWVSDHPFTNARRLTEFNAGEVVAPTWSPDGARIAVAVSRQGGMQLLTVDARTGNTSIVFSDRTIFNPIWGPNSDALYFLHKNESGWDLQRVAADGRGAPSIVAKNVQSAMPGIDKTHLIVRTNESAAFYKLPLDGGELVPLDPPPADLDHNLWTTRPGTIFGIYLAARPELLRIDVSTGKTQMLANPSELNWSGGIAVSPDGSQIVLSKVLLRESDLNLVELK
ncbi:winged helix-turn-helix domain-containing protein [Roseiterribacter gracilis]|uniref:Transcriptional regulator n=1 Tax=Roseiterribacter gracilis TaxID=2812848 RepID=A0A8S8XCC6_9PROT|nr:transcriptional regulator [Rhodospirillales bacterium TMPK1]